MLPNRLRHLLHASVPWSEAGWAWHAARGCQLGDKFAAEGPRVHPVAGLDVHEGKVAAGAGGVRAGEEKGCRFAHLLRGKGGVNWMGVKVKSEGFS